MGARMVKCPTYKKEIIVIGKNMLFQVIIPVVNIGMLDILIGNILNNTILPETIIIINNSSQQIKTSILPTIKFVVINPPAPLFVNESWNLGISKLSECDFVSILNDDIEIPTTFFKRIANGFKNFSKAGVICPCTVADRAMIALPTRDSYEKMKKKEGWAFTIRKNLLDTIPPIPSELKLFFGDDYFWWHVYRGGSGYIWYKDCGTIIYHAIGTSLRKICKKERDLQKRRERKIWYDLKSGLIGNGTFSKK